MRAGEIYLARFPFGDAPGMKLRPVLREVNPIVRPLARNVSAMLLVKSASTAVTVIAVGKLWKRNRIAAVLTMIGINRTYAVIVSNNAAATTR